MRDYAKICPQFWIGQTGKKIKKLGIETQLIALYLISNPHANMLGIYYLPLVFISHEVGILLEGASKALQALSQIEFCSYDEKTEYVWIHEMAFYQIGEQLKPNDNRVKGVNEAYLALPDLPFLKEFYNKYQDALLLENPRENISPLEGPCKPLQSQEQEQKQEQEQEQQQKQEQKKNFAASLSQSSTNNLSDLMVVFEHWKLVLQHPSAKLDDKRKKLISQALKAGYSVEQLCEAITGCSLTPHNIGNNDCGQRYDGLHIILRDADQIDRFINNARYPPKILSQAERHTQSNVNTLKNWLNKKMNKEDSTDGNK